MGFTTEISLLKLDDTAKFCPIGGPQHNAEKFQLWFILCNQCYDSFSQSFLDEKEVKGVIYFAVLKFLLEPFQQMSWSSYWITVQLNQLNMCFNLHK